MRKARILDGLFVALPLMLTVLLQGCAGAGSQVLRVPPEGYDQTTNYQFQAQVHADAQGTCQQLVVRVKALNKLYTQDAPPSRLQLFDDDCEYPIQFERVQYLSRQTGENVRLVGAEIDHFWGENVRLQNELMAWLWREGVV